MIAYYVLTILSVLLYLYSFFPISRKDISFNADSTLFSNETYFNPTEAADPAVYRLVLIVIDALRHDFVTPENMPYLSRISNKEGCSSLVKVESPTVTLPRIKALTTGRVPQFTDIVLNLISTESVKDSFLHHAVKRKKKIVFYGDDTWLKMYPDLFARSEGTSSFYVNDYTEVDFNVTYNVNNELKNDDWDIMILHYLGLDHIGHTHGPYSSLIPVKLKEMDEVIEMIHKETNSKRTLIAVTGDHGMKDSGGHGGTTYSETHVPLLLSGVKCSNDSIDQIDIPMVLSALLGLEFPLESVGKISLKLLRSLSPEKLLYLQRCNVLLLQGKDICESFDKATKIHRNFLRTKNKLLIRNCTNLYQSCLGDLNSKLVKNSIEQYDFGLIISCCIIIFCFTSSFLYVLTQSSYKIKFQDNALIFFFAILTFLVNLNTFFLVVIVFVIFSAVLYQMVIGIRYKHLNIKTKVLLFLLPNILHGISLASSSFIEEEHQIWYFFLSTLFIINIVKSYYYGENKILFLNFGVMLLFRVLRKLNQTGDKWAFLPDITHFLLSEGNFFYLFAFHSLGLFCTFLSCLKISKRQINKYFLGIILSCIFFFKIYSPDSSNLGKIIWCLILLNFICILKSYKTIESVIITWILISTLLLRPPNTILLPFTVFASAVISKQYKSKDAFSIAHLILGNSLYFCQGHSNSLASVNVAAGFVGLTEYIPQIVIVQVLMHTYSLPILTHILVLQKYNQVSSWHIFMLSRIWVLTVTFLILFCMRHHLFIWSVFAPKLLIESSHSVVLFIEILIYYCVINVNFFSKNKKVIKLYFVFKSSNTSSNKFDMRLFHYLVLNIVSSSVKNRAIV